MPFSSSRSFNMIMGALLRYDYNESFLYDLRGVVMDNFPWGNPWTPYFLNVFASPCQGEISPAKVKGLHPPANVKFVLIGLLLFTLWHISLCRDMYQFQLNFSDAIGC